jgi:hypothetical protein
MGHSHFLRSRHDAIYGRIVFARLGVQVEKITTELCHGCSDVHEFELASYRFDAESRCYGPRLKVGQ